MPTIFSPCRIWRYTLERAWMPPEGCMGTREVVAFIGLNPSTADEVKNDPTVTRCINYARRWGFHGMFMLNIFALRSTDPRELYRHPDPIGPETDRYLTEVIQTQGVSLVVAAWGNHGALLSRGWDVINLVRNSGVNLHRLGELTKQGQPRHPLYLKSDLEPVQL
ncbi:MAG: DUF1643 domain-containing protein [Proteobacteria bacterium]|nr:DUF1643 domain-containing protein [Pseudomonadota bacterium]MBU4355718.1 DUF1643 domain-containing protein [Pseudomonadota bacterium]MBU4448684.1 DUF1643 domain-containing protein [Pseudomonadota bacterium]